MNLRAFFPQNLQFEPPPPTITLKRYRPKCSWPMTLQNFFKSTISPNKMMKNPDFLHVHKNLLKSKVD